MLFGKMDYLRDGLIIHSTLDLSYQKTADKYMQDGIYTFNKKYQESSGNRTSYVDKEFAPIVEALSLLYNIDAIRATGVQQRKYSSRIFQEEI